MDWTVCAVKIGWTRRARFAVCVIVSSIAACSSAWAMASGEPDNHSVQARGPVTRAYDDRVSSPNDQDWFYYRVKAGRRVSVTVRHLGGDCTRTFVLFTKGPGGELFSTPFINASAGELVEAADDSSPDYFAPADRSGRFAGFVKGEDDDRTGGATGCRLRIIVAPASALLTRRVHGDAAFLRSLRGEDRTR